MDQKVHSSTTPESGPDLNFVSQRETDEIHRKFYINCTRFSTVEVVIGMYLLHFLVFLSGHHLLRPDHYVPPFFLQRPWPVHYFYFNWFYQYGPWFVNG